MSFRFQCVLETVIQSKLLMGGFVDEGSLNSLARGRFSRLASCLPLSDDCDGNLKCFQRGGLQPVPGCDGAGTAGRDYCYEHYLGYGNLSDAGDNGEPVSAYPLSVCEGDCDSDSDCGAGLYCYQRGSNSVFVPGCDGTPSGSKDYCIDVNPPLFVEIVGDNGSPPSAFPLGECQGDCDDE